MDAFPALATKPLGMPRAVRERGCSLGGGSSCRRGNPASRFLLWSTQISRQSWVPPTPGCAAAGSAGDHGRGCPGSSGHWWGGSRQGWDRGVICEPQGEVGPAGGREEKAELERRDSDGGKGKKNKNKIKINQADTRLLLAETRSMYWQSAWSRSRSKLGDRGQG